MTKTELEEAIKNGESVWVIQRDDGSFYFDCQDSYFSDFYNRDEWTMFYDKNISLYKSKDVVMKTIKDYHLQNCRPVRIKIEIVGEDDE